MSATLFISDIHLSPQEPTITAGFIAFLEREACCADALYILGDLFDTWIGDDDPSPLHQQVAAALFRLSSTGIPCYFIHGNRDFMLGKRFASQSGLRLLPAQQVIDLYGQPALIMHGDTLCTDDKRYQRFRRVVHQRWLQRLYRCLPFSLRLMIGNRIRTNSKAAKQQKFLEIMDVSQQTVEQVMQNCRVQRLIHGHTHRPAVHHLRINGADAERIVLGAWNETGSVIKVTPAKTELITFRW